MGDIIQFRKPSRLEFDGTNVFVEILLTDEDVLLIKKAIKNQNTKFETRYGESKFLLELLDEGIDGILEDVETGKFEKMDTFPLLIHVYEIYFFKSLFQMEYEDTLDKRFLVMANRLSNLEREVLGGRQINLSEQTRFDKIILDWAACSEKRK